MIFYFHYSLECANIENFLYHFHFLRTLLCIHFFIFVTGPTRPKSCAVAKSDSGVMKDINDIGTSQSDDVFEEADPSECSKELESLVSSHFPEKT